HFIFQDFVAGRAPAWPAVVPGRLVWAYLSGVFLIIAGAMILIGKRARWAAVLAGLVIFVWAFVRHIPLAVADSYLGGVWTQTGKALVLFGGSLAVAGSLPKEKGRDRMISLINSQTGFLYSGLVSLSLFMILAGIQHFLFDKFVATLVPRWIPGDYFWTYFAGVALIAGGIGLLIPQTARLAALLSGLMIFLWVLMLHIPRAVSGLYDIKSEWLAVFEALAFSGLAFLIAGSLPQREYGLTSNHTYAAEARTK
ncbi:MAG TPA: hypothetical protein VEF04_07510, partial [Blastocatellia bacterium]|nr:hypothetical protein [Blastocatellia bacterium]